MGESCPNGRGRRTPPPFGYQISDAENFEFAATSSAKYLSTEVAQSVTVVFVGMYVTGDGVDVPTWLNYNWLDYELMID